MSYWQGIVTGAALAGMVVALTAAAKPQHFSTIDVERINVREPDGALRMVIAGRDRFPGSFHKGEEIPRPDRCFPTGMLFLNEEGAKNGGLKGASKSVDGKTNAGASLTFDRYESDQTLQLLQNDSGNRNIAALIISDRPAGSMFENKEGKLEILRSAAGGAPRLFAGKSMDRASVIMLQDERGTPRILLKIDRGGTGSINLLVSTGNIIRSIGLES
jgi:hypothetical protein